MNLDRVKSFLKNHFLEIIFFIILFTFSWWLMWKTFDYRNGYLYISTAVWSDFAANIPLIRSFSWGHNFPPEYPIFPGEPIKYHFLFYFLVGFLEKIGLTIGNALNLPSIAGFFLLLISIYYLSFILFRKRIISFLSVIFFLFNGSFSFLEFFKKNPLSLNVLSEIISNKTFPSFGPYDGKIVSAFWNLNIYTNQRHLALAYFIVLLIVFLLIRQAENKKNSFPKWIYLLGLLVGILPFLHKVAFVMIFLILPLMFIFFPKIRRLIFGILSIGGILSIPQLIYQMGGGVPSFSLHFGYLIPQPINFMDFINYWFLNIGLSLVLIPAGFILSSKTAKKIFLCFAPLFLIGNLFQFSPEIAANHKFFNLFLIMGNMFTVFALYKIWNKKFVGKIVAIIFLFFLTLSGFIEVFPVVNNPLIAVADEKNNPDIAWIKKNTPPKSTFLNSSYLYNPVNLAGRKIFLGWPYFSWSAGYDTNKRGKIFGQIFEETERTKICQLLINNNLDYFTTQNPRGDPNLPKINPQFFLSIFNPSYISQYSDLIIYSVKENCKNG